MSKFTEGTRVVVIDNRIRKGVIDHLYDDLEIAIVKFEDGEVDKVRYRYITVDVENQEEETTEPLEKSEITITPDEFREIASKACAKVVSKGGPASILLAGVLLAEIHDALFYNGGEND